MNVVLVFVVAVIAGAALAGFGLYVEHSWKAWRMMREVAPYREPSDD